MNLTDETAARLAVMTVLTHALITRLPLKPSPALDTLAGEMAATARVIADALLREASNAH
jgi:hypothetical protein